MSVYHSVMSKLVYETLNKQQNKGLEPVYRDVDESKPVKAGLIGKERVVETSLKQEMDATEQRACQTVFEELVKVYDDPSKTIEKTQFSKTFDEWMPSTACAKFVASQMQSRYRRNEFFRSFTGRRVQLLDEDSHGRTITHMPTAVVRIEMDK